MIDHGASITDTQLQIAKDSALVILNAIDEHDKVCERGHLLFFIICIYISYHSWFDGLFAPSQISVLSVAETVRSCSLDQCYKSLLSPATSETKRKMSTFVSNVKASDGATQHAAGFEKAFQLLRNTTSHNKQSSKSQIRRHYCRFGMVSSLSLIVANVHLCVSHRHGDHLPVVWRHVSRIIGAGEESHAQCGPTGEPAPQQLGHDPHIRSHEWWVKTLLFFT